MGLFDIFKKKPVPKPAVRIYAPDIAKTNTGGIARAKQQTRNFQKDEAGLYPHEILLLSYYEKYAAGKPIAKFWEYEFGIDDVPAMMHSLQERGFADGQKLTQAGKDEIEKSEYIFYIRKARYLNISLSELSVRVNKFPNRSYRDLIWGKLNEDLMQSIKEEAWGGYTSVKYKMYLFLMEEKKYQDALMALAEYIFYEINMYGQNLTDREKDDIRKVSMALNIDDETMIDLLQKQFKRLKPPFKKFSVDEVVCVFTAYAFGHDEIAEKILKGKVR